MNVRGVPGFTGRPWALLAAGKATHWAQEFRVRGPEVTLRAAQALWLHMRAVRPEWPTDQERQQDLQHHLDLARTLDRAARALAGR